MCAENYMWRRISRRTIVRLFDRLMEFEEYVELRYRLTLACITFHGQNKTSVCCADNKYKHEKVYV